jgi:capsular polysaccharide transport system permease protein
MAGKVTMAEIKMLKPVPAFDGPLGVVQDGPKAATRGNRRWGLGLSFVALCLLPIAMAGSYFGLVATDRYAAGASFVIRSLDGGGTPDLMASMTGFPASGSHTSDSYVVRNYLESPDLLRDIDDELNLRAHYMQDHIDPIARLQAESSFEEMVDYWQGRITTSYDSTTGIVSFEVQAFDPGMAVRVARSALAAADRLVNELSETARQDSVQFAADEVARAEARLRAVSLDLVAFRTESGTVNPMANAQLDAELLSSLETKLVKVQSQIDEVEGSVGENSPILKQLNRQAKAYRQQIAERRNLIGAAGQAANAKTAETLAGYEALQIEKQFAEQTYASAMSSLEMARLDADRQQRYLGVFTRPFVPSEPAYPLRLRDFLLIAAAAFAVWAIAALVGYAVRDHMR